MENNEPSDLKCKTRTSAKEAVVSRWATRAETSTRVSTGKPKQRQEAKEAVKQAPCSLILETWKNVQNVLGLKLLNHLYEEQKSHEKDVIKKKKNPTRKSTSVSVKPKNVEKLAKNKETLSNTLAKIRVSSALQNQLDKITEGGSQNYLKSVLSILPSGFDESSALTSSIENRKRAFMLMDLGRVIRAHAIFLTFTCGFGEVTSGELPPTHKLRRSGFNVNNVGRKRKGVYIQPQFRVTKNPSVELLKLLVRLGVDLRCNTCDDILSASQAAKEEKSERLNQGRTYEDLRDADDPIGDEGMVIVDDVSRSRKPNGYFRRLLKARKAATSYDMDLVEVAVDSVDEVRRISDTIEVFTRRNNENISSEMNNIGCCRFMLCLPSTKREDKLASTTWSELVLSVHRAAIENNGELVGVSVDLQHWSTALETGDFDLAGNLLLEACTHLRLFRLLLISVGQYHIRIDLTGLPSSLTKEYCNLLTVALKDIVCATVTMDEIKQVIIVQDGDENSEPLEDILNFANDPLTSSIIFTADISDHLVARSGALCCRIIGAKEAKRKEPSDDEQTKGIEQHYYIDDGCYGSLGSAQCSSGTVSCESSHTDLVDQLKHVPVPLYGVGGFANMENASNLVKCTVWGPTCDGLDKVCECAILPNDLAANRDWLVFQNLGCGGFGGGLGLGTAFNGFDPPDVAYCVLGYFSGHTGLE